MPSAITSVLGSILGVGTMATVIAVPVVLSSKGEITKGIAKTETNTNIPLVINPDQRDKAPTNFKKSDCYGSFLFETNKGELIFCERKETVTPKPSLSFFYHTIEDGNRVFDPIIKIYVGADNGDGISKWEVDFLSDGETILTTTRKRKRIKTKQEGQQNLNHLGSQALKDICQLTKETDKNVLKCTFSSFNERTGQYKVSVKKGEFAF